jgi:Ribonuclease G/E
MAPADTILISASPGEVRYALVAAGRTIEFAVDRGLASRGDIFQGRVAQLNRALDSAFVDIGEDRPGLLKRIGGLSEGDAVAVEIVSPARRSKGAIVRRASSPPGTVSPLARLLGESPAIRRVLVDDPARLEQIRLAFPAAEVYRGSPVFETCDAGELWHEVQSPVAPLPGGGSLIIEETETATLIDINSGSGPADRANLDATLEIPRQVRLRGLAGHILIDPIPSRKGPGLTALIAALKHAVGDDPTPTRVAGRTPLGRIEMVRERRRPSLANILLEPAPPRLTAESLAIEAIRALLAESAARPSVRFALNVRPDILAVFDRRPLLLNQIELKLGRRPRLLARPDIESYRLEEESR